jgi:hypothetical protein
VPVSKKKADKKKDLPSGEETSRALAEPADEKLKNWADDEESEAYKSAVKLYDKIVKCYENKQEQSDRCEEYWNIFNAQLDENQQYVGNTQAYVPAVRDAVMKRVKRATKQLFPVNHKHVAVVGPTGEDMWTQLSIAEHYIRHCKIKSIVRSDLIAGEVTGQWALYVDWTKSYRDIRKLVKSPVIEEFIKGDGELPPESMEDDNDILDAEKEEIEEEEVISEGPDIVNVALEDIAIYPPTETNPDKATATSVRLRMSKDQVQTFIDEGVFVGVNAETLLETLSQPDGGREKRVAPKKMTQAAGVKTEGTYKYAMVYEVCTRLDLGGDRKQSAYVYYAGKEPIGIIRNPQWSGKSPLITAPIERISGTAYGISKIEPVKWLQWMLNDFHAMGMDSAQYSLLPIVMTDPFKNPNYMSMVLGLSAVWLTDPNSTKIVNFPQLWKDAASITQFLKAQIGESLDVNDSMMGKSSNGRKNNQQVGAQQQEQQADIQDFAERYEEEMLNPLIERVMELDAQFRTEDLLVETMGETGYKACIENIGPQEFGYRVSFRWQGTAYQMNLQRLQQMIAFANVARGIPPQQLNGRKFDMTPILEFGAEHICGPDIARKILIDERNLFTIPPDQENVMLFNGLPITVHEADDDREHIASHNAAATMTGDPALHYRQHIGEHIAQMQLKMQKAAGQQMPQQGGGAAGQGMPGGSAAGVPGTPRVGAQPGQTRLQGPPGTIHRDNGGQPPPMQ